MEHWQNRSLKNLSEYIKGTGWIHEEWRDIEGFDGAYQVSSFGRVKSLPKRTNGFKCVILKNVHCVYGYLHVTLYKRGSDLQYQKRIHRLVAEAFLENPDNLPEVNHIKGNKKDNRVIKLEWSTNQDNITHAIKTGLIKKKGEDGCNAKLSNQQAIEIFNSNFKNGELAKLYNVSKSIVQHIKTGRTFYCATGAKWNKTLHRLSKERILEIFNCEGSLDEVCEKLKAGRSTVAGIRNGSRHSNVTGKKRTTI